MMFFLVTPLFLNTYEERKELLKSDRKVCFTATFSEKNGFKKPLYPICHYYHRNLVTETE